MAQRRHHYEHAFERFLRDRRVPYLSVDEARKSLLPDRAWLRAAPNPGAGPSAGPNEIPKQRPGDRTLKNFDFVIYGEGDNLLVEIKGRRLPRLRRKDGQPGAPRMESWVTRDDIDALRRWASLFGPGFAPVFVFMYWCDDVPPDGLFVETLAHRGRWYTLRCIDLDEYARCMRTRSPKWRTVDLSRADFDRLSRPLTVPACTGFVREPVFETLG